jgi:hypothetical protein
MMGRQHARVSAVVRWWSRRAQKSLLAVGFGASLCVAIALPAPAAEAPEVTADEQLLSAMNLTTTAERAARLSEVAGHKVAEAVRADRRALWLTRTAHALRKHDGREAMVAHHGAEAARIDRDSKDHGANVAVSDALTALDSLAETPPELRDAEIEGDRDAVRAADRLMQAAVGLRDASMPVRESLQEVNAVRVRLELAGDKTNEQRSARIEEVVARRRMVLSDAVDALIAAAERLQVAGELMRGAEPSAERRVLRSHGAGRFGGLGVGVGAGFTVDIGGRQRVDRAHVEEIKYNSGATTRRIVRVDKTGNDVPHVMLEGHYLFPNGSTLRMPWCHLTACVEKESDGQQCWLCEGGVGPGRVAAGPFVGLQPGDDFIDAVGAGVMLGVRADALWDGDAFNLGLGYFADPNTQVLADGFSENQQTPAAETQVRYKDVTKSGIMLLMSYGF